MKMEYFFPQIFSAWSTIRVCLKKQPSGNDLGLDLVHKKMRRCCGLAWGAHSLCSHIFLMKTRFVVQIEKCVQNGTHILPSQPAATSWVAYFVNGITILPTTQAQNLLVIFAALSLSFSCTPITCLYSILPSYSLSGLSPPLSPWLLPRAHYLLPGYSKNSQVVSLPPSNQSCLWG